MKHKKQIILCISFCLLSLSSYASHWYTYIYELPHFRYEAQLLLGSASKVPDMFPVVVKLNDYVKEKILQGALQDKPVVYDIYFSNLKRERFFIEVYETPVSYRIYIHPSLAQPLILNYEELIQVIDYFAHPEFEPFYCGRPGEGNEEVCRDILLRNIRSLAGHQPAPEKETYEVYSIGDLSIRYHNQEFRAFTAEEETGVCLDPSGYAISQPIQSGNHIFFMDGHHFYVYEGNQLLHKIKIEHSLSDEAPLSNVMCYKRYPDWINFNPYHPEYTSYSYCYSRNRLYILNM